MAFTYERFAVVTAYYFENPQDLDGTEAELSAFDQLLVARYDAHITAALPQHGLPDQPDVRAMVALLATMSQGSGSAKQVERACRYYASTRPNISMITMMVPRRRGARRAGAKRTARSQRKSGAPRKRSTRRPG